MDVDYNVRLIKFVMCQDEQFKKSKKKIDDRVVFIERIIEE